MDTTFRLAVLTLGLAVASMLGVQRAADAGDTGRLLAGVAAGALVYELLDDDCCCHTSYACHVHPRKRARARYRSPQRSYSGYSTYGYDCYAPRGGVTVTYRSGGYIPRNHYAPPPKRHHRQYQSHRGYGRGQRGGHHGRGYSRGGGRYCR